MQFSVCIASRGRHYDLMSVIVGMWRLRSGAHDVRFFVGVDNDDARSVVLSHNLQVSDPLPITWSVADRQPTLGAVNNRLLSLSSPDAYIITTDRAHIITPHWDAQLADDLKAHPGRVLWLSCPSDPDPTHPVLPADYVKSVGWSPEIFPFWFDDTWNAEIEFMAYGNIVKVPVWFFGERGKTTRARDFGFWFDVFAATRPQRVEKAKTLFRGEGGMVAFSQRVGALCSQTVSPARIKELEARFADDSPPSAEYIAAKAKAEELLWSLRQ